MLLYQLFQYITYDYILYTDIYIYEQNESAWHTHVTFLLYEY